MNLLILATAWGPKHGGINSFNLDFAIALAKVLDRKDKLFCIVLDAKREEIQHAYVEGVILVNIAEDPSSSRYDESWAYKIRAELKEHHQVEIIDHWIGHDVVSGKAAVKGSELTGGKSSLIMHMNYGAYQSFKGENGQAAKEKEDEQRDLFEKADYLFANGPILANALMDLVGRKPVELIPGFADIKSRPPTGHFSALTFGRMDSESSRIKQGALAVAAFGSAVKEIRDRADATGPLNGPVRMTVAGITEPGGQDETDFKSLLEERAGRAIEIHVTKFEEDRELHFGLIGRASFAMMLSWHEGFGLTGWEAIAAEVPLIVGKNTGLFKLLENTLTRSMASALVEVIDVKGKSSAEDESNSFTDQDEQNVRDSIKRIAANLEDKQESAKMLKSSLVKSLGCTWEDTAKTLLKSIGLEVGDTLQTSTSPNETPESTADDQSTSTISKADESSVLAIPTDSWPPQLKDQAPDCLLLRPENRVVRFHSFRADLKDEIVDWVTAMPEKPIRLRLDAGEGGAGKTRLMIEVCIECAETHGWTTGFLHSGNDIARELPKLLSKNKPTLIVIDYAETRASEISNIVKSALAVSSTGPLRLLLLSRDGRDWWNRLAENSTNNQAAAAIMRDASTKQGPYYLQQRELNIDQRAIAFKEAMTDFAARKREAVPEVATPDLSAPYFGQPIYVHMAALQSLRGKDELGQNDLLETTLGHEKAYWRKSLEAVGMPEDRQMLQLELTLAAITLVGGCPTLKDARELIERTPLICDATADEKRKTLDILAAFYSSNLQLSALQPDILGEVLVDQVLHRDSSLLDTVFDRHAKTEHAEAAMTILARMARRNAETARWLEAVLDNYLPDRIPEAIAVAQETGGPIADLMGKAIRKAEGSHKKKLVQKYGEVLPKKSENLSDFSVTLHDARLDKLKLIKGKRTSKQNKLVLEVCSDLARSLNENGMLREAVGPALLGLRITRRVFSKGTPSDRSQLAIALGNSAKYLSDVGEFHEGLDNARQAELIWRELKQRQPGVYDAKWLISLGNLSSHLSEVGEFHEALEKARQVEVIWRELAQKKSDAHNSDWAGSVANLAGHLGEVGEFHEALEKAREAEFIRRELARAQPDTYNADWASSLSNLGTHLNAIGKFHEGLEKARQAELIRRELARAQPDTYNAAWADSLANLGSHLCDIGEFHEGLEKAQQAELIRRELARVQPDAYNADWATSLSNLAGNLSDVGEFHEGLEKARQAELIRRELAQAQPDAHNAKWAMSLGNLGDLLLQQVDYSVEDVLHLTEKARSIFSILSKKTPAAYSKWEAFVLRSASEAQLAKGELQKALEYSRLSSQKWSEVHIVSPGVEMVKTILSTHTLIRCELANHSLEDAKVALGRWISENGSFVQNGGNPAKAELRKMASFVLSDMGQSSFDTFPENVRRFGELETLQR